MRMLALMLCLLMLAPAAMGEEVFYIVLTVRADDTPFLLLSDQEESNEALLNQGDQVILLALGANYCLAEKEGQRGYIASDMLALPENTHQPIRVVKANVSPTAQGYLTLRDEPKRTGNMLDKLKFGTLLLVLGEEGEFSHVATSSRIGYVMTQYTAESRIAQGEWRRIENGDRVNFRSLKEYADRSVMAQLQPGEMLYVFRDEKGWALAEGSGFQGYIVSKYLSASEK